MAKVGSIIIDWDDHNSYAPSPIVLSGGGSGGAQLACEPNQIAVVLANGTQTCVNIPFCPNGVIIDGHCTGGIKAPVKNNVPIWQPPIIIGVNDVKTLANQQASQVNPAITNNLQTTIDSVTNKIKANPIIALGVAGFLAYLVFGKGSTK